MKKWQAKIPRKDFIFTDKSYPRKKKTFLKKEVL